MNELKGRSRKPASDLRMMKVCPLFPHLLPCSLFPSPAKPSLSPPPVSDWLHLPALFRCAGRSLHMDRRGGSHVCVCVWLQPGLALPPPVWLQRGCVCCVLFVLSILVLFLSATIACLCCHRWQHRQRQGVRGGCNQPRVLTGFSSCWALGRINPTIHMRLELQLWTKWLGRWGQPKGLLLVVPDRNLGGRVLPCSIWARIGGLAEEIGPSLRLFLELTQELARAGAGHTPIRQSSCGAMGLVYRATTTASARLQWCHQIWHHPQPPPPPLPPFPHFPGHTHINQMSTQ